MDERLQKMLDHYEITKTLSEYWHGCDRCDFTGSCAAVHAVDVASGKLLWKHDPETWKHNPRKMNFTFGANRGAVYENGRVFVAAVDDRLIALDAKTGVAGQWNGSSQLSEHQHRARELKQHAAHHWQPT